MDSDLKLGTVQCYGTYCTVPAAIDAHAAVQQTFLQVSPPAANAGGAAPAPVLVPFSVQLDHAVDVAWKVMSRKIVSDNFGARIAKLYYGIEVFIGNNSGYPLQIAGIYFDLPCARTKTCVPIPSDPYHTVRSSLEREQEIGGRNTSINIIKAIGPMLTGGTALFNGSSAAALHHKALYSTWVDIFSNPFEKGLELIFPDQTVRQLTALDNQTLRDNLIVSDNTTVPTVVFVDRRAVPAPAAGQNTAQFTTTYKTHDFDAEDVKGQLGTLRLEGQTVDYLRRISVTSNSAKPSGAANSASPSNSPGPANPQSPANSPNPAPAPAQPQH